ncbi:acetolactate synthase large subunit [Pseudonocardia sp. KRD-184]|uniref:Acetolactate synthase large subunit n=5 Tax=Pseudonocardia oceani TaxID=2792013 RepID=A0ABS6UIA8_9PSEU|nr:acetolactate synthase large subunit [Pseudonocardia oceani]MBW0100578.1 acetolactate synthase large subunit [Pseudonocardia oceani]MBW0125262.1 acetolactate synthase large subunit [Pseudonocardia oceani]MBW0131970.1 acetolactate synthase large subunit [Pseudonocardia oceani]
MSGHEERTSGATALLRTLHGSGVDVCFANPGTSEMHFVAALDGVPGMRAVLALFEGVATGAADGYARMAGRPAATLLHLGPGLGNGLANLHNARRAHTPVVAVVGDHALTHAPLDAPLQSDIAAIAGSVSGWVRHSASTADVGADAVAAAHRGQVATLVLPADVSWGSGGRVAPPAAVADRPVADPGTLRAAADALASGEPAVLLIGGDATRADGLAAANRVAAATGARLLAETFPARLERGAGVAPVGRLAYLGDAARHQIGAARHVVLVGTRSPVAFFGYPGKDGDLVPDGRTVHAVVDGTGAATAALEELADLLAPGTTAATAAAARPDMPTGELTVASASAVVGALLPEGAIVVDEAITSGLGLPDATAGAPRHDWLTLTGGAIGYGLPAATGAAVACPDRPVWCLQADGSAMYTISALWTHAREGLDVTTVVYHNSAYAILRMELAAVGATGGPVAAGLFDLGRPELDFTAIARGMGVPAVRATTADELADALRRAAAEPGPHLVEAMVPALV